MKDARMWQNYTTESAIFAMGGENMLFALNILYERVFATFLLLLLP